MRRVHPLDKTIQLAGRNAQLAGQLAVSLASLLLAYSLLQAVPADDYGSFAFMLVLQAFGVALQQALVGAPLLILQHRQHLGSPQLKGFFLLVLLLTLLLIVGQSLFLLLQGYSWQLVLVFAASSTVLMFRWYGRLCWQNIAPARLVISDALFSITVLLLLLLLWGGASLTGQNLLTLERSGWLLLLAATVASWPFAQDLLKQYQSRADWPLLRQGFAQQGKPALLGVFTLELSANLHSYLLILLAGSAAFAPVAAAMLFFRPLAVVQGSLAQSERPALARALVLPPPTGRAELAARLRSFQRLACWLFGANCLVLAGCYYWFPSLLWPDLASYSQFAEVLLIVALLALLRSLRGPASALLQAGDQFGALAKASLWSACLSVPLVVAGFYLAGVTGTMAGVLVAELVLSLLIQQQKQRLLAELGDKNVSKQQRPEERA